MATPAPLHGHRGHGRVAQPTADQRNTPNPTQGRLTRDRLKPISNFHHVDGRDQNAGDNALGLGIALPEGALLLIGRPQGQLEELEELIIRAIVIAGAVAILLSILGGVLLGHSVQRRAARMNEALSAVAEGDLARRLPVRAQGDEFDALAGAVNATLTRLQEALARLNQVTGDIAHDLRTPLARMRQRLERASRGAATGQVPREVVDRAVADIDEVLRVFAALLRIAQIESGERRASFALIDLSAALADVVDALAPTAEDAGRPFSAVIVPGLLGVVDKPDSQAVLDVIQDCLLRGGGFGAVSDERRGMGGIQAILD